MICTLTISKPELPSMPRADNVAVLEDSLGKRSALVGANAAQCGEGTGKVGDTDRQGAEKEFAHFALRWQFGDSSDAQKSSHFRNITQKVRYDLSMCGVID